jgi:hypothetical protein
LQLDFWVDLQESFCTPIAEAEVNAVQVVVVPEDGFEKIIRDPGGFGKVKDPYVGGIFCEDLECGRSDDGEVGNGDVFVHM